MKILIDRAIPFLQGVLEPFAEVVYLDGAAFTREVVASADAMIIRTRTRCDKALLQGSKVQFIATATIGFDHIDLEYSFTNLPTFPTPTMPKVRSCGAKSSRFASSAKAADTHCRTPRALQPAEVETVML